MFGLHVSAKKDLNAAIKAAADFNVTINAAQIFVIGPMNSEVDRGNLKIVEKHPKIAFYAHAAYLDHLLGKRPHFTKINVRREIALCDEYGIKAFTIHIPRDGTPLQIAAAINNIDIPRKTTLLLETEPVPAHANPQFLAAIIAGIKSTNVGITLDTAHLFSAGFPVYDQSQSMEFLSTFDTLLPSIPAMLHLNDQKWAQGSGSDEHMPLQCGQIWRNRPKSIKTWVNWAQARRAPIILEHYSDSNYPILQHILEK